METEEELVQNFQGLRVQPPARAPSAEDIEAELTYLRSPKRPSKKPKVVIFEPAIEKGCHELSRQPEPRPTQENRVAIFLSGPAGGGKSTFYQQIHQPHYYYNVDTYYEELLRINSLLSFQEGSYKSQLIQKIHETLASYGLDVKIPRRDKWETYAYLANRNILSVKATLMNLANRCMKQDFEDMVNSKKPLVIDRPADSYSALYNQYFPLLLNGYRPYMVIVYTSLFEALDNNHQRATTGSGRGLPPQTIYEVWKGVIHNIPKYQELFGNRLYVVSNVRDIPLSRSSTRFQWLDSNGMTYQRRRIKSLLRKYLGLGIQDEDTKKLDQMATEIILTQRIISRLQFISPEETLQKLNAIMRPSSSRRPPRPRPSSAPPYLPPEQPQPSPSPLPSLPRQSAPPASANDRRTSAPKG